MALAIIADTHMPRGSRRLPAACVERLRGAEVIVHAGDFIALEALEEFEALGTPLVAVHGNVDADELVDRLPETVELEHQGVVLGMVHDAGPRRGRLERMRRRFPDADAVVFGHSHMPLHERDGGFQIFNPGSPTERRRAPARSMGVAHISDGRITFEHVLFD